MQKREAVGWQGRSVEQQREFLINLAEKVADAEPSEVRVPGRDFYFPYSDKSFREFHDRFVADYKWAKTLRGRFYYFVKGQYERIRRELTDQKIRIGKRLLGGRVQTPPYAVQPKVGRGTGSERS